MSSEVRDAPAPGRAASIAASSVPSFAHRQRHEAGWVAEVEEAAAGDEVIVHVISAKGRIAAGAFEEDAVGAGRRGDGRSRKQLLRAAFDRRR